MCEKYNGWTNYETWVVNLWIGESQDFWDDITSNGDSVADIANTLKDYHIDDNPLADGANVYTDLLGGALSSVNWDEIAQHFIDDRE